MIIGVKRKRYGKMVPKENSLTLFVKDLSTLEAAPALEKLE